MTITIKDKTMKVNRTNKIIFLFSIIGLINNAGAFAQEHNFEAMSVYQNLRVNGDFPPLIGNVSKEFSTVMNYHTDAELFRTFGIFSGDHKNGKTQIYNLDGNLIMEIPKLTNLGTFSSDLKYKNNINEKYFRVDNIFYDSSGNKVEIKNSCSNRYIPKSGKCENGSLIFDVFSGGEISSNLRFLGHFSEGWAVGKAKNDNSLNFVNIDGKKLSEEKYESANDFSDGLAMVKKPLFNKKGKISNQYKDMGYINTNGEIVIPLKYTGTGELINFNHGYAVVEEFVGERKNKLIFEHKIINKKGSITYTIPQHTEINNIEGFFLLEKQKEKDVRRSNIIYVTDFYYIVDAEGNTLIKCGEKEPYIFESDPDDGVVLLFNYADRSYYILQKGNSVDKVTDHIFVSGFYYGKAVAIKPAETTNLYTQNKHPLAEFKFDFVSKVGQYGYIGTDGKVAIPYKYRFATNYAQGKALAISKDNEYLLIDEGGNEFKLDTK